ncbi:sulfite exporter taue/safe [Lucifera butyrica]|uniref:Probable membrane transporter protein n=1 Tax=Lucifera butyrica TaxID=1351585 RepID=A0A498R731_9FIRM|nr:sulfite exporter TauE/SafE family protein [Lucifera butyrica]VBB05973.1 sulfite exporter taue/safe [Lucifera butyrica]
MIEVWAGLVTFAATTVLTVAGVGAAFILVPIYLALGIELHTSMSTALLLNGISMIFASITFAREKLILWRLALPILIAATVLSPAGAYASQFVPRNHLLLLFILFLLFAASMMLFYKPGGKKKVETTNQEKNAVVNNGFNNKEGNAMDGIKGMWTIGAPVGGVAGFLGGLLGVGGGNIIVPALVWLGISPKKASATSSFIVIFSSLAGFAGRASLGNLDGVLLAYTVAGSIAGALLGSWLMSKKLQNKQVKIIIGVLLYLIAGKMLLDLLK